MSSKHLLVVAATAASLVLVAPALGSTIISFRTPTGNIGCVFSSGLTGAEKPTIRCDIRSRLRPAPHRPKRCPLDYGDSLEISQLGHVTLVCHGDTAIDPHAKVLHYGQTWRHEGLSCTSRFDGLTCTNKSKHGFFMSRQSWRLF